MSDKEKAVSELIQSGDIPPIGQITDAQAAVLIMLHQQNLNQSETNRIIFSKLDKAAEAASHAKDEARKAAETGEKAANGVLEIKEQFKTLNGKTSKTIERVQTLEDIEQRRKEDEIKKDLVRQGMLVIPRKISIYVKSAGKFSQSVLAVIGILTLSWPLIKWLFHIH